MIRHVVNLPARIGARPEARRLLKDIPDGAEVIVNGYDVEVAAPGFMDEVVRTLVVDRKVEFVVFNGLPAQAAHWVAMSAQRREAGLTVVLGEIRAS